MQKTLGSAPPNARLSLSALTSYPLPIILYMEPIAERFGSLGGGTHWRLDPALAFPSFLQATWSINCHRPRVARIISSSATLYRADQVFSDASVIMFNFIRT